MKIIILGYMASGKSFIGKKLSVILEYKYLDLDEYIEIKENKSVKSIFKDQGEIYFRKAERKYLQEVLKLEGNSVISLGGGTPCYYNNMDLITQTNHTKSVYLRASIPTLVKRLQNEKHLRPLISHIKTEALLAEFIGKHLFERSYFYNQSNYTVDANKSVENILEELQLKLL